MPSRCEPSALAYIEAAHAGLPAIGTTVGGFSDQLRDGGRAVDPQDLEGLVDAMLEFANPDIAAQSLQSVPRFVCARRARVVSRPQ